MRSFFYTIWLFGTYPHLFDYNTYSFTYIFFAALIVSFIYYIVTFLIEKIPIIKYLTP